MLCSKEWFLKSGMKSDCHSIYGEDTEGCSSIDAQGGIENENDVVPLSCSNTEGTAELMEGANYCMSNFENAL